MFACDNVSVFLVPARVKKVKTLKPSYFVSGAVVTFVGFPQDKRVVEVYARCLLCKADLSIAGHGLASLRENWRGVEHTRLEQKYRIMMQMPLLNKACRPVTPAEDRRIHHERMTEPLVYLESELSLSVDERIAIEEAEASPVGEANLVDRECVLLVARPVHKQFCECDILQRGYEMVESWRDNMSAELRVECRSLTYP